MGKFWDTKNRIAQGIREFFALERRAKERPLIGLALDPQ